MDNPCTFCQRRGFQCSPKTFRPKKNRYSPTDEISATQAPLQIASNPTSPDDERFTISEWMYLEDFLALPHPGPYAPLLLKSRFGLHVGVELHNITEINPHVSRVYRSAVLGLMSSIKNDDISVTSKYLAKYRHEAQNCINNASLEEVVYASYVVAICSIIGGQSVEVAINVCREFCKCFVKLTMKQKRTDDWIELLWHDLLASLYYVRRQLALFGDSMTVGSLMESVALWEKLLETSYCLLVSDADIVDLPLSMSTPKICHKVTSLCIYMQICLDQFLIGIKVAEGTVQTRITKDRLYSVVDRILRLVSHLPGISDYIHDAYQLSMNPANIPATNKSFLEFTSVEPRGLNATADPDSRDAAAALLFAFARLVRHLLKPTAEVDDNNFPEPQRSAIAICRICASLPLERKLETLLVKRSLFWAGLILNGSTFPQGSVPLNSYLTAVVRLWIQNRLQVCIDSGYHWHPYGNFNQEKLLLDEFFKQADGCSSLIDIWKVDAFNVSLFYYSSTLVTWFFGLNMVRFKYKSNIERSLMIT